MKEIVPHEAVQAATHGVIRTMAAMEAKCVRICTPASCEDEEIPAGVSIIMKPPGRTVGFMALSTSRRLAAGLIGAVTGSHPDLLTDDQVSEGMAEILNMIAGDSKNRLAGTPYHFRFALPRPCSNFDLRRMRQATEPAVALLFRIRRQPLVVITAIRPPRMGPFCPSPKGGAPD